MATALIESGRNRLGHSLALAMWWCGWLMLGEFGRRYTPLMADGVAPLAVWLCSVAASVRLVDLLGSSPSRLSKVIVAGSAVTCAALLWTPAGGGAAALLLAAASWGVLVVAADRVASPLDGSTHPRAPDIFLAGFGAVMAWMVSDLGVWGAAGLIALCGMWLAAVYRRVGKQETDRQGAGHRVPAGWACLVSVERDWIVRCTRAAMVPMMASLMFSSEWCIGAGSTERATAIGVHLASMFLLPCLLKALDIRLGALWLALPMGVSGLCLVVRPGTDSLMVASMAQSVAWGLSYVVVQKSLPGVNRDADATGWSHVLIAIGAVTALGLAVATVGPIALSLVQAALGIGAVAMAAASLAPLAVSVAWRRS